MKGGPGLPGRPGAEGFPGEKGHKGDSGRVGLPGGQVNIKNTGLSMKNYILFGLQKFTFSVDYKIKSILKSTAFKYSIFCKMLEKALAFSVSLQSSIVV